MTYWINIIRKYAKRKHDRIPTKHLIYIIDAQIIPHSMYACEIAKIPKLTISKINEARRSIVRASCPGFSPPDAVDEFLSIYSVEGIIMKRTIKFCFRCATSENSIVTESWKEQCHLKLPLYSRLKQYLNKIGLINEWNDAVHPDAPAKLRNRFWKLFKNSMSTWQRNEWAKTLDIPLELVHPPCERKKNSSVYTVNNGFGTELFHLRWYSTFKEKSNHNSVCPFCELAQESPFHIVFRCSMQKSPSACQYQKIIRKFANEAGELSIRDELMDQRLLRLTSYDWLPQEVVLLRKATTKLFLIRATLEPHIERPTFIEPILKRPKAKKRSNEEKEEILATIQNSETAQDRSSICANLQVSLYTSRAWAGEKKERGEVLKPQSRTCKNGFITKHEHRILAGGWMKEFLNDGCTQKMATSLTNEKCKQNISSFWHDLTTPTLVRWSKDCVLRISTDEINNSYT